MNKTVSKYIIPPIIIGVCGIIAATIGVLPKGCDDKSSPENVVHILTANIQGIGRISPATCKFENPCVGLIRGSVLNIIINRRGYANVYLQDKGLYYNQEGSLAINNSTEGTISLWPGTTSNIDHHTFKLYILTSDKKIQTSIDDDGLLELPDVSNGKRWGPIFLKLRL